MGNEVVNESRDCCKEDNQKEESGCCLLSILESAGNSISGAVSSAEKFGTGVIQGAASGVGLNLSKETAENIAKGAVAAGIAGGAVVAAEQAIRNPGAAAVALGAGAVGAGVLEVLKQQGKDGKGCATDCATDAAIGAAIGAGVGLATGDATRAATLAAMGAITGCAARCAAEMCKGCCAKPADPVSLAKDLGKTVLDHVQNRPVEAVAEGALLGIPGVVGGAMIRKMMENQKDCCKDIMKSTCENIKKQAEMLKKIFDPTKLPVIEMGPVGPFGDAAVKAAAGAAAGGVGSVAAEAAKHAIKAGAEVGVGPVIGPVAVEAGAAAAQKAAEAAKAAQKELEQHRKDNPTASAVERGVGYGVGGVLAGKAVGTAIEYGDVKARQAYQWVKSWFE